MELREDRQILFFNPQARGMGWEDEVEFSIDDLLEPTSVCGSW